MELKITNRFVLNKVPSVSGIEFYNNALYLIGDNSPWLFKLNLEYAVVEKIQIYSTKELKNGVLKKKIKPDFEAMTIVPEASVFYVFGSGSKTPTRDVLIKINANDTSIISQHSLEDFYSELKRQSHLTDDEFNIEAAIATKDDLILFNRGKNLLIRFRLKDFELFIEDHTHKISFSFQPINLPKIGEIQAGFSGATYMPELNKIIFTASVENTSNWIDDGEVLGSFLGVLDLGDLEKKMELVAIQIHRKNLPLKIESVAVLSFKKEQLNLLLVSDSDGGDSEIIEASLNFQSR